MGLSPWFQMDAVKYNGTMKRIADLDPQIIVAASTPAIMGEYVTSAIDMMYHLRFAPAAQLSYRGSIQLILQPR
jgi:hypothetical protein